MAVTTPLGAGTLLKCRASKREVARLIKRAYCPPRLIRILRHSSINHSGIPAANHPRDEALRIRSTGLVQVFGGAGESLPSMLKSPFT